MKKSLIALLCICCSYLTMAQDTAAEPVATGMRAENKIYVVVAVLLTILAGLFFYVIRLDKKISKLEKSA